MHLAEGDTIEILIEGKEQLSGALWVLGMPLALFIVGYLAGRALFPDSGEGPAVGMSVASLALGMVAGIFVQKGRKLDSLPKVVRKIDISEFEHGGSETGDMPEGSTCMTGIS